ncbi:MAG: ABC transporter ATP-binding protein [Bacilli bacterium]|jgi:iron complex transport system ATP-binding protein|nr:ABC transporter ATP-binding protein [Bacilli bacterium]
MIEAKSLSYRYSKGSPYALKDVSFSFDRGEICALLGPNGAGKSTILKTIIGLLRPLSGGVYFDGEEITRMRARRRARRIAYIPQHIDFGSLSVYDTVLLGRLPYFGVGASSSDRRIVDETIRDLKLEALALKPVNELSGGEKQKVAIARALAQAPELLVFDEPTSNLDIANELVLLRLIKRLTKEKGIAVIIAIHDLNLALELADRFVFLRKGRLIASDGKESVTAEIIDRVFAVTSRIVAVEDRKIILFGGSGK